VTLARAIWLVCAGVGAGLSGSIAGLASLISYPALLAIGLPPVTANVTNTVALVCSSTGSIIGSRPDLVGQGARVRQLALAGVIGGATGGALLLVTPADSFERLVPFLIGGASLAILARRRIVESAAAADVPHPMSPGVVVGVGVVGIYGGYFGAGAGVMLLALLLFATGEALPTCNGIKNVVLGLANGVAAVAFACFGDVRWVVAAPLGLGLLVGGRLGPIVVRRAPHGPLRALIALAGLGLAVKLAVWG
jgi:uncharacterized protein